MSQGQSVLGGRLKFREGFEEHAKKFVWDDRKNWLSDDDARRAWDEVGVEQTINGEPFMETAESTVGYLLDLEFGEQDDQGFYEIISSLGEKRALNRRQFYEHMAPFLEGTVLIQDLDDFENLEFMGVTISSPPIYHISFSGTDPLKVYLIGLAKVGVEMEWPKGNFVNSYQ